MAVQSWLRRVVMWGPGAVLSHSRDLTNSFPFLSFSSLHFSSLSFSPHLTRRTKQAPGQTAESPSAHPEGRAASHTSRWLVPTAFGSCYVSIIWFTWPSCAISFIPSPNRTLSIWPLIPMLVCFLESCEECISCLFPLTLSVVIAALQHDTRVSHLLWRVHALLCSVSIALWCQPKVFSILSFIPTGFSGPAALRLSAFGAKVMAAMGYKYVSAAVPSLLSLLNASCLCYCIHFN